MDQATAVSSETIAHSASLPTYQELAASHQALETELQKLNAKRYLTADEEIEAVRLKKAKLHLKDEMARLRFAHAAG